jgi:hypothetical protein
MMRLLRRPAAAAVAAGTVAACPCSRGSGGTRQAGVTGIGKLVEQG